MVANENNVDVSIAQSRLMHISDTCTFLISRPYSKLKQPYVQFMLNKQPSIIMYM